MERTRRAEATQGPQGRRGGDPGRGQVRQGGPLASDKERFFTEPHYHGFPAVLVRLPLIEVDDLEELIVDAWRCQAPRAVVEAFDRGQA